MFYVCKYSAMRLVKREKKNIIWNSFCTTKTENCFFLLDACLLQINKCFKRIVVLFPNITKHIYMFSKYFDEDEHLRSIGFICFWSALTHFGILPFFSVSIESNYIRSQFFRFSYSKSLFLYTFLWEIYQEYDSNDSKKERQKCEIVGKMTTIRTNQFV